MHDGRGDRRADGRVLGVLRVVRDGQRVASRPIPDSDRGPGERPLGSSRAGAGEEARRVNRAGADEDALCAKRSAATADVIVADDRPAVLARIEVEDLALGDRARAVLLRRGEVGEIERVLGRFRAAARAGAAGRTGLLLHPVEVRASRISDRERRLKGGPLASELRHRFHELVGLGNPPQSIRLVQGGDFEHVRGEVVERLEAGPLLVFIRPGTVEDGRRWSEVNVRVNERAASVAGGLHADDLLKVQDVPEPLIGLPDPAAEVRQERAFGGERRKVFRPVATTALEDENVEAGLREAAGGHGAAETAADDDDIAGLVRVGAAGMGDSEVGSCAHGARAPGGAYR